MSQETGEWPAHLLRKVRFEGDQKGRRLKDFAGWKNVSLAVFDEPWPIKDICSNVVQALDNTPWSGMVRDYELWAVKFSQTQT